MCSPCAVGACIIEECITVWVVGIQRQAAALSKRPKPTLAVAACFIILERNPTHMSHCRHAVRRIAHVIDALIAFAEFHPFISRICRVLHLLFNCALRWCLIVKIFLNSAAVELSFYLRLVLALGNECKVVRIRTNRSSLFHEHDQASEAYVDLDHLHQHHQIGLGQCCVEDGGQ